MVFGSLDLMNQAWDGKIYTKVIGQKNKSNRVLIQKNKKAIQSFMVTATASWIHGGLRSIYGWRGVAALGGGGAWLPWRSLGSAMATRYGGVRSRRICRPWRHEMAARGRGTRSEPSELFCGIAGVLTTSSCAGGRPGGGGAGSTRKQRALKKGERRARDERGGRMARRNVSGP
jgi:hypothetical protein